MIHKTYEIYCIPHISEDVISFNLVPYPFPKNVENKVFLSEKDAFDHLCNHAIEGVNYIIIPKIVKLNK